MSEVTFVSGGQMTAPAGSPRAWMGDTRGKWLALTGYRVGRGAAARTQQTLAHAMRALTPRIARDAFQCSA